MMSVKRIGWLVLILALGALLLAAYGQAQQVAPPGQGMTFDALARWMPGDAEQAFFLNFKPDGEAGRHWERIRRHLETNPAAREGLDGLFRQFRVEEYGLGEFIVGPVVSGYEGRTRSGYVIAPVSDEEATRDALLQHFEGLTWEQEEYEGRILYHGRDLNSWQRRERLAWTIHDGHLFLSYSYHQEPLTQLRALVSLAQADSLAALPAWRVLRGRLPETPMGLIFFLTEQARGNPPPPGDASLGAAMGRQSGAMGWAAVPEKEGMRVEIAGEIALQPDAPLEVRALFDLPAVDPTAWTGLPADTAFALVAHDASVLWPWLSEAFNLDALDQLSGTVGLDLGADLAGASGPLAGDFALAITPPLPQQPVIRGLPAGQLLIPARGASGAQAASVQAAMEGRGAVFGPAEVEGVALQTQVGTELSGYAISYGFDGDTLLFGSSPAVIGEGVSARREGKGLVTTEAFRAMSVAMPDDPSFVVYLNGEMMTSLVQANMSEEQYQKNQEYLVLEAFQAIGLGLRLTPGGLIDGTLYFSLRE